MTIIESMDGKRIEQVLMGEGRGAEWYGPASQGRMIYVRLEPHDWIVRLDSNGKETDRFNPRYAQRIVWFQ